VYVDNPVFQCTYPNFVVPSPNADGVYVYGSTDVAADLRGFECITSTARLSFTLVTPDAPPSDVATQLAAVLLAQPGLNTTNIVVDASSTSTGTGRRWATHPR
jgi:hypothetical protein